MKRFKLIAVCYVFVISCLEIDGLTKLDESLNKISYDLLQRIFNSSHSDEFLQNIYRVQLNVINLIFWGEGKLLDG